MCLHVYGDFWKRIFIPSLFLGKKRDDYFPANKMEVSWADFIDHMELDDCMNLNGFIGRLLRFCRETGLTVGIFVMGSAVDLSLRKKGKYYDIDLMLLPVYQNETDGFAFRHGSFYRSIYQFIIEHPGKVVDKITWEKNHPDEVFAKMLSEKEHYNLLPYWYLHFDRGVPINVFTHYQFWTLQRQLVEEAMEKSWKGRFAVKIVRPH